MLHQGQARISPPASDSPRRKTRELSQVRQCEVMLVVGGRQSANTRRLRDVCEEQGTPAYHIETAADIDTQWLDGKTVIGLTAGASTPDWMIEDVARAVNGGTLPDDWKLHHPDE